MGGRLNEAEINVNVASLREEHEYDLDRAVVKCFKWTPLHAAASSGQLELFQQLLSSRPELADALDSQERSLLHLASTNGHIEIVKALIQVRPEMCLARDRDGANPLHAAAMRGKVKVLDELFRANHHAARAYRVDRGERETILHLCVKYNQLEFLHILLEKYFKGVEFVNAKDNAGNTILHLAVADRRYQIIEHVLSHSEVRVNATNNIKQTAMDILLLGRKKGTELEGIDKEIQDLLQKYHCKRAKDTVDPTKLPERKNGILVAAVLMATLAFQAGVTPPGGVWQDDSDGHKSGEAVMAYNHPFLFWYFFGFNVVGFVASIVTINMIMIEIPFKTRKHWLLISSLMGATIISMAITYLISLAAVAPGPKPSNRTVLRIGGILTVISGGIAVCFLLCMFARSVRKRESKSNAVDPASENEANV